MNPSQPNRARHVGTPMCLALIMSMLVTLILPACAAAPVPPPANTSTPTARPTDLGANLIKNESFPSLSYGIQAFLWWNAYTRSRDLERVRQMHFQYVKQIIEWHALRPDPNTPYNWQSLDDVVNETNYRQLKLVGRIGKPPDWATLPPTTDPDGPPINLDAFGTFCGDLAARYKGKIIAYQVWNEPNLAREWQDQSHGRPPNP